MKILYLITKTDVGGAQTHVSQLLNYFVEQGHDVGLVASGGGWLQSEAEKIGAVFFENKYFKNSLNPLNLFRAMKRVRAVAGDFRPDIVHCHSSVAGLATRLAIRNRIPTVYTAHGWDFAPYRSLFRRLLAWVSESVASRYCSQIICVSEYVKHLAVRYRVCDEEKISVIYNGFDVANGSFVHVNDKIVIGYVARLDVPKLPLLFVDIFRVLNDKYPNHLEARIYGDGTMNGALVEKIKKQNLSKVVKMVGPVLPVNMKKEYLSMDIFVLTSQWESFGLSTVEAMSYGLPVVVSDVGGLREVVEDGAGFLVKNRVPDFVSQIDKLVIDKKLRILVGGNAKKRIADKFSILNMQKKTEKIYKELIG